MRKKNIGVVLAGVAASFILPIFYAKKSYQTKPDPSTAKDTATEEKYYGVRLKTLNEIAKSVNPRNYCTIADDCLMLHFKSNRGHQTNHAQLYVDKSGKLVSRYPGFPYPGQVRSGESEFLKRVNESLTFQ